MDANYRTLDEHLTAQGPSPATYADDAVKLPNGCWLERGKRVRVPKAHIWVPYVMEAAGRFGWELEHGRSSPSSEVIRWPRQVSTRDLDEFPSPPETWPIIEHEPEHEPTIPPDFPTLVPPSAATHSLIQRVPPRSPALDDKPNNPKEER